MPSKHRPTGVDENDFVVLFVELSSIHDENTNRTNYLASRLPSRCRWFSLVQSASTKRQCHPHWSLTLPSKEHEIHFKRKHWYV